MVAFSSNQLPASINTVEKLHVWSAVLLSELFPSLTAVEDTGTAVRVIQSTPFLVAATAPPTWRMINRTSIPLNGTWRRGGLIWLQVSEVGSGAIPGEFTA